MMGKLETFDTTNIDGFYRDYVQYLLEVAKKVNLSDLKRIIRTFIDAYDQNKTIFFIGNGGSAATASHFCEDLAEVGRKCNRKIFKCLSLTDNIPYITAAGNDYGYEQIFVKQMEGHFSVNDVLVSITASGNSPNVIEAIKYAKHIGGKTVGLLGFDGGKAYELCDTAVIAKTNKGEYGPVEDMHIIFDHLITTFLFFELSKRDA